MFHFLLTIVVAWTFTDGDIRQPSLDWVRKCAADRTSRVTTVRNATAAQDPRAETPRRGNSVTVATGRFQRVNRRDEPTRSTIRGEKKDTGSPPTSAVAVRNPQGWLLARRRCACHRRCRPISKAVPADIAAGSCHAVEPARTRPSSPADSTDGDVLVNATSSGDGEASATDLVQSETSKPARLPRYFAQLDLSDEQRTQILELQASFAAAESSIKAQLQRLAERREREVRELLTSEQRDRLTRLSKRKRRR